MRGCLFILVLAATLALGGAWFGSPVAAGAVVHAALAGAGFDAESTDVTVTSDPPIEILSGHADRVDVGADGASFEDLDATRVDIALIDVDLLDRSFADVDGVLDGVRVRQDGGSVPIGRVRLKGPAGSTEAVITMAGADVERVAADALNDALGLPVVGVALRTPDILRVEIAGQGADARLVIEPDGRLALAVPIGNIRVELVDPAPLELDSVTVVGDELVLTGSIDMEPLLLR